MEHFYVFGNDIKGKNMQSKLKKIILLLSLFVFSSCSTNVEYYKDMNPSLNFNEFFEGELEAHGIFKDRFGKVKKSFVVKMSAKWSGGLCILHEDFIYNDGSKSTRVWKIQKISEQLYQGTADDVSDVAIGVISGNTLKWDYKLNIEVDGEMYQVDFDDWMYLISKDVLLNHSYMNKWGIRLGEVILSIRKLK